MGEAIGRPAEAALGEIRRRLAGARERCRLYEIAEGVLSWGAVLALAVTVTSCVVLAFRPGVVVKLALFVCLAAALAGAFVRGLIGPLFRDIRDEAVARRVESAFPELQNALINALQLGDLVRRRPETVGSVALAEAAIRSSRDRAREFDLSRAVTGARLRRVARWALPCLGVLVFAFAAGRGAFLSAFWQVLRPFDFVPQKGSVRIVSVKPGDVTVRAGMQVTVEVEIAPTDADGPPPEGRLFREFAGGPETEHELALFDRTHYGLTLTASESFEYRVEISRTQSRLYRVEVKEQAAIERVDLEYRYPAHTGLDPVLVEDARDEQLDISAPVGTIVSFKVTASRELRSAYFEIAPSGGPATGEKIDLEVAEGSDLALGVLRLIGRSGLPSERRYAIRLVDETDVADDTAVWHALVAEPDRRPTVEFVAPAKELDLPPGACTSLVLRADDDYGIERVEIRYRRNKGGEERVLRTWGPGDLGGDAGGGAGPRRGAALTHEWRLSRKDFGEGDVITYWAAAYDRDEKRPGVSSDRHIRLVDQTAKAREKGNALADLLAAVDELVKMQDAALSESKELAGGRRAASRDWARVVTAQTGIRRKTLEAVLASKSADSDVAIVRAVLRNLASGEMAKAVLLAEHLEAGAADASPEALTDSQERTLATLRKLLGVLPRAVKQAMAEELKEEEGSDLPDAAAEKLRELSDQLRKFVDEQRKVISGTSDLAKMPVDDFSEDDLARQEALAATEEKWEKFLKDAYSDFSKIPRQDFSSEQLLSELIELYTEVEMAKDALSKKANEIAVPLEQAGLELAESMTTHIDKWLPDTPDRDKWSMEEALGEYETPMAELPTELEDMIGELMEEEEDFFEEMEDVTSSWADSIDKGAGWDAMDGPISNMSAQGVTGNRLPNTSEIGGRSGEGRTGKASGEMVEDTATGKGGRRTPTRLSPDAFLGGEIKDTSKDPAGGATGGGKVSGGGEEGLEGPVPPDVGREMERLKGAQASLRNKAERIAMQLRARAFPEEDIQLTLAQLRALEADLKDGRYTNVARRRDVLLDALGRSREFVEGTARVELDRSKGPEGFDEQIGSGAGEVDPEGYEELLRAYREAIRAGGR
jgi:hypothetical protein